jgi:hypothetical protein
MAYVWLMCARFESLEAATEFKSRLDPSAIPRPTTGEPVEVEPFLEVEDGEWEVTVVPKVRGKYLNGHGGPSGPDEEKDLEVVGRILYERVRSASCHHGTRWYAIVGTEVASWLSIDELEGRLQEKGSSRHPVPGLVVSARALRSAGSPSEFVPFGEAHWVPWQGPRDQ